MAETVNIDKMIDNGRWSPFQTVTIGLCAAVTVLDGFDTQAIAYVAPVLAREWGLASSAFGPVFSAGLIGMMVGALGIGPIADRRGRKLAVIISVALMGIFSLATIWASSVEQLLILRFLTGLGLGGAMPNVIALSAEYTPSRWRSTAVGIMFCGFPLGAVLGGLVAAQIIPVFGWHSVFLVGGVLPLLLLVLLLASLPESVRFLASRQDRNARVARLMARIFPDARFAQGTRFVTNTPPAGDKGAARAEMFGPGRLTITVLLWVTFFMNLLMYYFLINWLPLTLQQAGIDLSRAILFTALLNAGGIVGTIVLARVIDKRRSFRILVPVLAVATVAIAAVGYAGPQGGWPLFLSIFLAGFCVNGAQNNMNALAAGLYSTPSRATGVGFALGIGRIGSIIGPIVGGLLLAAQMSLQTLFIIGALPALVAAVAMWILTTRARNTAPGDAGAAH